MARVWDVLGAVFFLGSSGILGWIGVGALSNLGEDHGDSGWVTYVVYGGFFLCAAVAALVGAALLLARSFRR